MNSDENIQALIERWDQAMFPLDMGDDFLYFELRRKWKKEDGSFEEFFPAFAEHRRVLREQAASKAANPQPENTSEVKEQTDMKNTDESTAGNNMESDLHSHTEKQETLPAYLLNMLPDEDEFDDEPTTITDQITIRNDQAVEEVLEETHGRHAAEPIETLPEETTGDEPETHQCQACGSIQYPTDQFCRGCGKRITRNLPEENPYNSICPECHSLVRKEDRFCFRCGKPLWLQTVRKQVKGPDGPQQFCPNCGNPIRSSDKKCPWCGTKIKSSMKRRMKNKG